MPKPIYADFPGGPEEARAIGRPVTPNDHPDAFVAHFEQLKIHEVLIGLLRLGQRTIVAAILDDPESFAHWRRRVVCGGAELLRVLAVHRAYLAADPG